MINTLFSEEPGVLIEVSNLDWIEEIRPNLNSMNIPYKLLGWTKDRLI